MERSEAIARKYFGLIGRMPRKRKKQVKKAIKLFIDAEIISGNWDVMDYITVPYNKTKEYNSYGSINLIPK